MGALANTRVVDTIQKSIAFRDVSGMGHGLRSTQGLCRALVDIHVGHEVMCPHWSCPSELWLLRCEGAYRAFWFGPLRSRLLGTGGWIPGQAGGGGLSALNPTLTQSPGGCCSFASLTAFRHGLMEV